MSTCFAGRATRLLHYYNSLTEMCNKHAWESWRNKIIEFQKDFGTQRNYWYFSETIAPSRLWVYFCVWVCVIFVCDVCDDTTEMIEMSCLLLFLSHLISTQKWGCSLRVLILYTVSCLFCVCFFFLLHGCVFVFFICLFIFLRPIQ